MYAQGRLGFVRVIYQEFIGFLLFPRQIFICQLRFGFGSFLEVNVNFHLRGFQYRYRAEGNDSPIFEC